MNYTEIETYLQRELNPVRVKASPGRAESSIVKDDTRLIIHGLAIPRGVKIEVKVYKNLRLVDTLGVQDYNVYQEHDLDGLINELKRLLKL